ncbi:patatin-like phospholipase family protein [Cupriavidus basilensis]
MRVFTNHEISIQAVLASSCLPSLFQAVEIEGEYYWDGGYMGNPPIYPLIYETDSRDVLIIRINPIRIPDVPTTAREILDRVNTLSFNSSLMREMRAIEFVSRLIDEGALDPAQYRRMFIHNIDAETERWPGLGYRANSMLTGTSCAELYTLGRERADSMAGSQLQRAGNAVVDGYHRDLSVTERACLPAPGDPRLEARSRGSQRFRFTRPPRIFTSSRLARSYWISQDGARISHDFSRAGRGCARRRLPC